MSDVKVFVSYSWSVEKQTGVVNEIQSLCPTRSIEFVRDENAMQHGDVIMDFINNLTSGDHIITVFSKPYFHSPWCMYELLQIMQKGEMKERTHPVIADDCNLQDIAYRIGVVKYWTAEHEKIKELLEGVDPTLIGSEYKEANRIRDIAQNVSDLMSFAKGRLTTPLADLRGQDYSQILDQIQGVQTNGSGGSNTGSWKALDDEFITSVCQGVEKHLKRSPVYLEKLGSKYGQLSEGALSKALIDQCNQGEFRSVINKMQAAFKEAWDDLSSASVSERNNLLDAADSLASNLVLFNVKEDWLASNYPASQQSSSYQLPRLKLESANVALSRLLGAVPSYKKYAGSKGSAGVAKGMGNAIQLESGAKKEQAIPLVLKMLAAALMPDRNDFPMDTEELAEEINETLEYYRTHEEAILRKRHFIMLPKEEAVDGSVYHELNRLLPEMAWVSIEVDGNRDVFLISDLKLKTAIEQFFLTLEGANPT